MKKLLLFLLLAGCLKAPATLTLPPPTSLPSTSLLPEKPVAYPQPKGAVLIADSVVMDPATAAALAGELQRLQGLPGMYQEVERKQAALVLQAQAAEAKRVYKRAVFYQKWAPPAAVTVFVLGVAAGVAISAAGAP